MNNSLITKLAQILVANEKYSILYVFPFLFEESSVLKRVSRNVQINDMICNGWLELLKEKKRNFPDFFIDSFSFAKAAQHNHLSILKWAFEEEKIVKLNVLPFAIDWASEQGHLEVVKWLYERGFRGSSYAIDTASYSGYYDVVQYLFERHSSYSIDAINWSNWKGFKQINSLLLSRKG